MNLPLISDQVCNIRSTVALLVISNIDTVEPCYREHLCDEVSLKSSLLSLFVLYEMKCLCPFSPCESFHYVEVHRSNWL